MTLEESLIEHCSPTLAGIKVASLYRFSPEDHCHFAERYRFLSRCFSRRGMKLTILKGCRATNSWLLYLYREEWLERLLSDAEILNYLADLDYDASAGARGLLRQLTRRICLQRDFPHEIGIFLGYPLEDVKGFIENKGKDYACSGCWKSYGDPGEARRRFSSYRACKAIYKRRFAEGTPIDRLIAAA